MKKRGTPYIFSQNIEARAAFFLLVVFLLAACSNKTVKIQSGKKAGQHKLDFSPPEKAHVPQHIVLFLGYGFADTHKKQQLLDYIETQYGFLHTGGIISIVSYPDDVSVSGKIRIGSLNATLERLHESRPISAFITVGAPQGMHTVLASLQDAGRNIAVFSLFPQDEMLGTEAGSDLVIDYRPGFPENADALENTAAEESDLEYSGDCAAVLSPIIQAALNWNELKNEPMFVPSLRAEFFKQTGCNLVVYTDSATGLRSKNRYVLEGIPRKKE